MYKVLYFVLCIPLVVSQEWVVNIESGAVRGWWREDYDVWAFTGIPYATPPLGELRFKAPMPSVPWNEIYDATDGSRICVQTSFSSSLNTTEDCLIINVFAPQSARTQGLLPVLFFVHGGSLTSGNGISNYNPRWTTRLNIILVTFNYRLGPFGYMCLGTDRIPGNAGPKDILAALRWTKKNIEAFGGDPEAVTIYGESASGFQTEILVLSKATEGLFRGAIIESGSALSTRHTRYNRLGAAKVLANSFEHPYLDDLDTIGNLFETVSAEELHLRNIEPHSICVERNIVGIETLVSDIPRYTLLSGNYRKVPMMFAYTELDGMPFAYDFYSRIEDLQNEFITFLPRDLTFRSDIERNNVAQQLREIYFGTGPITNDSLLNYIELVTDIQFVAGMLLSSLQHAMNAVPVYIMEFSYRGGFNQPAAFPDINVASHADIVAHVMDLGHYNNATLAQDQIVRDRMTELFTNFVKYGNPTPASSTLGVEWLPFTQEQQHYLNVGTNLSLRQFPKNNLSAIWSQIYNNYYYPPLLFENSSAVVNMSNLVFMISVFIVSILF